MFTQGDKRHKHSKLYVLITINWPLFETRELDVIGESKKKKQFDAI